MDHQFGSPPAAPTPRGHACDPAEKRPAFEIGRTASVHRPQLYPSQRRRLHAWPRMDQRGRILSAPGDTTRMIRRASRRIHFQHFADARAGPPSRTGLIR